MEFTALESKFKSTFLSISFTECNKVLNRFRDSISKHVQDNVTCVLPININRKSNSVCCLVLLLQYVFTFDKPQNAMTKISERINIFLYILIIIIQIFFFHSRYFQFQQLQKLFASVQLMLFNNKTNSVKDNQRGKSVGCKLFSFTGVRFFEPKFIDSLNTPSIIQSTLTKSPSQIKVEDTQIKKFGRRQEKNSWKQNINPTFSNFKDKKNEITLTIKQDKLRICKIRGFNNIGNTCYMNSALQCLLNLSKFNSMLMLQLSQVKNKKYEVASEYFNLLQNFIQNFSSSPFTPSRLKSTIGKKKCRFLGSAQQDAQQFLTAFLQIINEEMTRVIEKPKYIELENDPCKKSIKALSQEWWNYYKKRDDSIICDYFQGQLISTVTCNKCDNKSVTFDNIWGLPLSLSKTCYSVSEIMKKNWTTQLQITDYYCNKCKKHRVCTKKIQFYRLPEILVMQLKRFQCGKWKKQKIKTSVKLSDTLNLSQYVNLNSTQQNCLYKLSSIVHHYGQVDYGHYTASVYKQKEKKWFLLNDSKTSQNIPDSPSNTVYLLFYQKISK